MVSHDHLIRMGIGKLLGTPLGTWEDMDLDNASLTVLRYEPEGWRLDPELTNVTGWQPEKPEQPEAQKRSPGAFALPPNIQCAKSHCVYEYTLRGA